jgi:hypothetical protein
MTTAEAIDTLVNSYKASAYMEKVTRQIADIREIVSRTTSHSALHKRRNVHEGRSYIAKPCMLHISCTCTVVRAQIYKFIMAFLQGGAVVKKEWQTSFLTQSLVLTKRSFVNMYRDLGYYWLRFAIYIMLCLCVGTVFYDIGHSYGSILVSKLYECSSL